MAGSSSFAKDVKLIKKEQDQKITEQLLQAIASIKPGKTPRMLPFECNSMKYVK